MPESAHSWRDEARRSSARRKESEQGTQRQPDVKQESEQSSCDELVALLKRQSPAVHALLLKSLGGDMEQVCKVLNELEDEQGTCAEHLRARNIFAVRNLVIGHLMPKR